MAFACGATSAPSPVNPYVLFSTSITPPTVAAATRVPRNFQLSCFLGVLPIQYPILRSVINAPATESAVHTTPPIIRAAVIPAVPFSPTATITIEARMRVMRVIPLTGLDPTIAIAFAATVVNRNAITPTMSTPTTACQMLSTTPNAKKPNTTARVTAIPITTIFIDMSLWVLITSASAPSFFLLNSLAASPRADFITPKDFTMPTIPAVAMPPMPICLA